MRYRVTLSTLYYRYITHSVNTWGRKFKCLIVFNDNTRITSQEDIWMSVDFVRGIIPSMLRKLLGASNVKVLNCVDKMHSYLDLKKEMVNTVTTVL